MATVQNWNPVAGIRMPNADPTRALAAASASFGNIGDQLRANRKAESLADYNAEKLELARQEQAFREGAPERALEAEQATFDRGVERRQKRATTLADVLDKSGGSIFEERKQNTNLEELFKDNAAWQGMSPEEKASASEGLWADLEANKYLTSDIATARPQIRQDLAATGLYDDEQLETATEQSLESIFKGRIADPAQLKAAGVTGSGATGSSKFVQDILLSQFKSGLDRNNPQNQIREQESLQKWKEATVPKEKRSKLFGLIPTIDIMSQRAYGEHVDKVIAQGAEQGISQGAILKGLDTIITDEHTGDINIKSLPNNHPFFETARAFDQQQAGGAGGLDLPTMLGIAGAGGAGGGGMTTTQALQAMDHSNASRKEVDAFVVKSFTDRWGGAKVKKGEVNPNTGMAPPENAEDAQVQEALLDQQGAVAPGESEGQGGGPGGVAEPNLAEALGGTARGAVETGSNIGNWLGDLNSRYIGDESMLAKILQGESGLADDFSRGYRGR